MAQMTKAGEIISELKEKSPDVKDLVNRLKANITDDERNVIKDRLRHEYEIRLHQSGIPPGVVTPLATMFVRNDVAGTVLVCSLIHNRLFT